MRRRNWCSAADVSVTPASLPPRRTHSANDVNSSPPSPPSPRALLKPIPLRPQKSRAERSRYLWWVPLLVQLVYMLGLPLMWTIQLVRLVGFVVCVLPGLVPQAWRYVVSRSIVHGIPYGDSVRQRVDVYLPLGPDGAPLDPSQPTAPVLVFATGGAWIIGYRMWGFLFGLALQRRGVLCVSVDYRNYPQVRIQRMVDDVGDALAWTVEHAARYGGDPGNISLVGQSAGAHLSAMLLLRLVLGAHFEEGGAPTAVADAAAADGAAAVRTEPDEHLTSAAIRRCVFISGPYDIARLVPSLESRGPHHPLPLPTVPYARPSYHPLQVPSLESRGLHPRLVEQLTDNDPSSVSPSVLLLRLRDERSSEAAAGGVAACGVAAGGVAAGGEAWPPIALFHGTADRTVPWQQSQDFADRLRACGAREVTETYFASKSHTDPILEDPLAGAGPEPPNTRARACPAPRCAQTRGIPVCARADRAPTARARACRVGPSDGVAAPARPRGRRRSHHEHGALARAHTQAPAPQDCQVVQPVLSTLTCRSRRRARADLVASDSASYHAAAARPRLRNRSDLLSHLEGQRAQ